MSTKGVKSCEDIEEGQNRLPAVNENDVRLCYSDADDQIWHSPYGSNSGSPVHDDYRLSAASNHDIGGGSEARRSSSISNSSLDVDMGTEVPEIKLNVGKVERDCRICHLTLETSAEESGGIPIVLGCSCKGDLAAAHKQCAETWFKIKGNRTCEICGSTAKNVVVAGEAEVVEHWNEPSSGTSQPVPPTETRSFWQGHRLLNFLLACMEQQSLENNEAFSFERGACRKATARASHHEIDMILHPSRHRDLLKPHNSININFNKTQRGR